jgi:hypothetical protein
MSIDALFHCISLNMRRCTLLVDGHDGILRNPLEQPSILRLLHLVPLVLSSAHRSTRVHHVQEKDVQLGRENQRSMESGSRSRRSCEDSEPGKMQHLVVTRSEKSNPADVPVVSISSTAAVTTHPLWKRLPRIPATLDRSYLVANRNT